MSATRGLYCDGHGETITAHVAERLAARGIIVPHPGRGTDDGIDFDDYTLAPDIEWDDVYAAIKQYSPFHGGTWPAS